MCIFENDFAYRDFTPAHSGDDSDSSGGAWLFNPGMREMSRAESDRRAAAGEPFVLRFHVPRGEHIERSVTFTDLVYGEQSKKSSTTSKTSRCCARTGCRPTIWHRVRMTPIWNNAHHPRPGPSLEHVQARPHFRSSRRYRNSEIRPPAIADRARRRQVVKTEARSCRKRDNVSRRRFPSGGVRQLSLSPRLESQGQPEK